MGESPLISTDVPRGVGGAARARLIALVLLLAAIAFALVVGPAASATHTARAGNNFFQPADLTVNQGDTVSWSFEGTHTVTSSAGPESFDSGTKASGDSYSKQFGTAGTYSYFCRLHPDEMRGTVRVNGASAPPTNPTGTAPDTKAPSIRFLRASPSRFRRSTRFRFRLSERATVKIRIRRLRRPRRTVALFKAKGRQGSNSIRFSRRLRAGRYELILRAVDAAGNRSRARRATFRVIRRSPRASHRSRGSRLVSSRVPAARTAATRAVGIKDFAFGPRTLTINVGDTVVWRNKGPTAHSATADDGNFDTGILSKGASGSHTFRTAGTFSYHCEPHPFMKASLKVVASGAGGSNGAGGSDGTSAGGEAAGGSQTSADDTGGGSGSALASTGFSLTASAALGSVLLGLGWALRRFPRPVAGVALRPTSEGATMGITDKVTGRLKQAVGGLAGSESLRREGQQEERKGQAKDELAREDARLEREEEIAESREDEARRRAAEAAQREFAKAEREIDREEARVEAHEARADQKAAEVDELERRTDPDKLQEERTRDELYATAQELGIERRSDMTKEELAEEIRRRT